MWSQLISHHVKAIIIGCHLVKWKRKHKPRSLQYLWKFYSLSTWYNCRVEQASLLKQFTFGWSFNGIDLKHWQADLLQKHKHGWKKKKKKQVQSPEGKRAQIHLSPAKMGWFKISRCQQELFSTSFQHKAHRSLFNGSLYYNTLYKASNYSSSSLLSAVLPWENEEVWRTMHRKQHNIKSMGGLSFINTHTYMHVYS